MTDTEATDIEAPEAIKSPFRALQQFDPSSSTRWYTLPIEGMPRLHCRYAGRENAGYFNAQAKVAAEIRSTLMNATEQNDVGKMTALQLDLDRQVFPGHVVFDWEGWDRVPGMEVVEFSVDACKELMEQLHDHLFHPLAEWVSSARNFYSIGSNGAAKPTAQAVAQQAGN